MDHIFFYPYQSLIGSEILVPFYKGYYETKQRNMPKVTQVAESELVFISPDSHSGSIPVNP